ncbi:MAG: ADP-heptose--lipooligosaccharide heptosyltransferase II, partial [uncultured Frankineae bacterium]
MRVVVLRALGLGDLLTAVPALRALRRARPDAEIVLAMPAGLADLARLSGAVDEVVDTAALAPLERSLHAADLAVNLHGRGPQSTALLRETAPQ